jgi:hypothetical protein
MVIVLEFQFAQPKGSGQICAVQLGFADLFHHRLKTFPTSIAARLNVSASVRYTLLTIVPLGRVLALEAIALETGDDFVIRSFVPTVDTRDDMVDPEVEPDVKIVEP